MKMLTNSLELGGKSLEVSGLAYWCCLRKSSSLLVSSCCTFLSARFRVSLTCLAPIRLPRPLILFISLVRRLEESPVGARLDLTRTDFNVTTEAGTVLTFESAF